MQVLDVKREAVDLGGRERRPVGQLARARPSLLPSVHEALAHRKVANAGVKPRAILAVAEEAGHALDVAAVDVGGEVLEVAASRRRNLVGASAPVSAGDSQSLRMTARPASSCSAVPGGRIEAAVDGAASSAISRRRQPPGARRPPRRKPGHRAGNHLSHVTAAARCVAAVVSGFPQRQRTAFMSGSASVYNLAARAGLRARVCVCRSSGVVAPQPLSHLRSRRFLELWTQSHRFQPK